MSIDDALVMILAGGEGKRLFPLTQDRAKPAVPFGGRYRIIDFVLNNFINSGFYKIKVLTQYKSDSLNKHISKGWALSPFLNQYVDLVPAQMRTGGTWYQGTADAVYQNAFHIHDEDPDYVCVFGGRLSAVGNVRHRPAPEYVYLKKADDDASQYLYECTVGVDYRHDETHAESGDYGVDKVRHSSSESCEKAVGAPPAEGTLYAQHPDRAKRCGDANPNQYTT